MTPPERALRRPFVERGRSPAFAPAYFFP